MRSQGTCENAQRNRIFPFIIHTWMCVNHNLTTFDKETLQGCTRWCGSHWWSATQYHTTWGESLQLSAKGSGKKRVFLRPGWLQRGKGVSSIDPDRMQMWKCWPVSTLKIGFLILKKYIIVRGLKIAFLCPFLWCLISFYPWQSNISKEEFDIMVVG